MLFEKKLAAELEDSTALTANSRIFDMKNSEPRTDVKGKNAESVDGERSKDVMRTAQELKRRYIERHCGPAISYRTRMILLAAISEDISDNAFRVMFLQQTYGNGRCENVRPSNNTIAALSGKGILSIKRANKELKDLGWETATPSKVGAWERSIRIPDDIMQRLLGELSCEEGVSNLIPDVNVRGIKFDTPPVSNLIPPVLNTDQNIENHTDKENGGYRIRYGGGIKFDTQSFIKEKNKNKDSRVSTENSGNARLQLYDETDDLDALDPSVPTIGAPPQATAPVADIPGLAHQQGNTARIASTETEPNPDRRPFLAGVEAKSEAVEAPGEQNPGESALTTAPRTLNGQGITAEKPAQAEFSFGAPPNAPLPTVKKPYSDEFEEFWLEYPRKSGKKGSAKAFSKLHSDQRKFMVEAAKLYAAEVKRDGTPDEYIKVCYNWIGHGNYEDYIEKVINRKKEEEEISPKDEAEISEIAEFLYANKPSAKLKSYPVFSEIPDRILKRATALCDAMLTKKYEGFGHAH